jgi:outer membrane protein assembly factor BamB
MRLARLLAALVLSVLVEAAASGPVSAATVHTWTQFHDSYTKSGYNATETILNTSNVSGLKPVWQKTVSSTIYGMPDIGTPVVSATAVYALGGNGDLEAFRRSDGKILWTTSLGATVLAQFAPVLYDDVVIVPMDGAGHGWMVGLNARTGATIWKRALVDHPFAEPTIYGDNVYFATGNYLYDLNARTGAVRWRKLLTPDPTAYYPGIYGPVAVSGGGQFVVAASLDGWLYELNARTGALVWKIQVGLGVYRGGPAIYNGIIYVPEGRTEDENSGFDLVAVQVSDHHVLWRVYCGDVIRMTPATGAGSVFVGGQGFLRAFDATTGALKWNTAISDPYWAAASPILANGVVYTTTSTDLEAFNASTGEMLFRTTSVNKASPVVLDGRVYAVDPDPGVGRMTVFGLR